MNNYDYPAGADNEDAPWNEEEIDTTVTISITMSKTTKVTHSKNLNLDSYELKRLVEEQVTLPSDSFETWYVDDFIVNKD